MLSVVLYLELGILSDLLVTGYYLAVSRGDALLASCVSIPIALLGFWSLRFFNPSYCDALAYAVGNAIGCYVIMKARR